MLAWYHGDRGQQRVSTPEFAILTLLLLLGGGAFWYYQRASEAGKDAAPTASAVQPDASPGMKDARPSVAVLPFENRSREEDDAFFVDGIHDDILTQLSKVSALRVISRTSVERFRNTELPVQEIAQQLGVKSILEGGVQRGGDHMRINVQLIDAGSDAHLWAETYDRELTVTNIFAIQSELAAAIAGALKTTLTPAEQARAQMVPTQNLQAWEAYQLCKQRMATRTTVALTDAMQFCRKAMDLDPKFALAYAGLADAINLLIFYGGESEDVSFTNAERAAGQALELDPNLAEAWASAGNIANSQLQLDRAEQMLRRAIVLNPNYAPAHHWLSMNLTDLGRRDEALSLAERAVALDPLSAIINNWLAASRANVGRFDDALVAYKKTIEIDPTVAIVYEDIGDMFAYGLGRLDRAVPWYEKAADLDPGGPMHPASLAVAHLDLGDDAEAGRWVARTLGIGEGTAWSNYAAAQHYLARGEEESARRYAQRAAELDPGYLFLMRDFDLRKGNYTTARARYAKSFPQLFAEELPKFSGRDAFAAVDLAAVLQQTGESERAGVLLDRSAAYFRTIPRLGYYGSQLADVQIHALRGEKAKALTALREALQAGWRKWWQYYRDFSPNLASIRNEPEFKAIFADIERDMAQQRARLAARPKDAPLELTDARGDRTRRQSVKPRAPGPDCAAARSSSGGWSTSPPPGGSCRASSTSARPSTGRSSCGRSPSSRSSSGCRSCSSWPGTTATAASSASGAPNSRSSRCSCCSVEECSGASPFSECLDCRRSPPTEASPLPIRGLAIAPDRPSRYFRS